VTKTAVEATVAGGWLRSLIRGSLWDPRRRAAIRCSFAPNHRDDHQSSKWPTLSRWSSPRRRYRGDAMMSAVRLQSQDNT